MVPQHQETIGILQILDNNIIRDHPEGSNTIRAGLPDLAHFWTLNVTPVSKTAIYGSE